MAVVPNGIRSTQELLEAQSHIWNHMFSFIKSMSLKCAIELGIPDVIHNHKKPIKLSELVNALSIKEAKTACLGRLMRLLVHSKFFTMTKIEGEEEEGYWLTPASRLLLRRDEAFNLAPFVLCTLDPILMDSGHGMSEWLRDDEEEALTPFVTTHGRSFWELMGEDARMNKVLNEGMSCDTELLMSVIVKDGGNHVFQELESMVDVGGGTGTMARAIAHAFPGIKCTVLDLPHVVQGLQGTSNLKFMEGDMFKAIPNAQAISLKHILNDWSDQECIQILSKCKEAIPSKEKGGKVIIIDMVVGNNIEAMETQLLVDIGLMLWVTGKVRTEQEWANIFHAAGFPTYKITPILGVRSLIEVFP
ncbi:hypothetical protein ACS0TY_016961 [Phlomoides rotata]